MKGSRYSSLGADNVFFKSVPSEASSAKFTAAIYDKSIVGMIGCIPIKIPGEEGHRFEVVTNVLSVESLHVHVSIQ